MAGQKLQFFNETGPPEILSEFQWSALIDVITLSFELSLPSPAGFEENEISQALSLLRSIETKIRWFLNGEGIN